jgi:hypothetical protein
MNYPSSEVGISSECNKVTQGKGNLGENAFSGPADTTAWYYNFKLLADEKRKMQRKSATPINIVLWFKTSLLLRLRQAYN